MLYFSVFLSKMVEKKKRDEAEMVKVKVFDYEHEKDLEDAINKFLKEGNIKIENIFYNTSHFSNNGEQIYSFSCFILYK